MEFWSDRTLLPVNNPIEKKGLTYRIGRTGESLAARYLVKKGYFIWQRNWTTKSGELDMVAIDKKNLIFIEVKTRLKHHLKNNNIYNTDDDFNTTPLEAINEKKEKQLKRLADEFIDTFSPQIKHRRINSFRFDAIAVVLKPHWHNLLFKQESLLHYLNYL